MTSLPRSDDKDSPYDCLKTLPPERCLANRLTNCLSYGESLAVNIR